MAAKAFRKNLEDESGQSIVEFLLMLPMLIGMVILLVRVNMAIQVSIVNQQYARAQALFLTFNSPHFPELEKIKNGATNQLVAGVGDEVLPIERDDQPIAPAATSTMVARNRRLAGRQPTPQQTSEESGFVRVWNTVTLCSESKIMLVDGQEQRISPVNFVETRVRPSSLAYCRGADNE
jgi:hypothetical protein